MIALAGNLTGDNTLMAIALMAQLVALAAAVAELRQAQQHAAQAAGGPRRFRDVLPNPYEVYIGLEAGAASIRNFEPVVIPGLIQTEEYARAMFRNGSRELDRDEVERRVEVRMARQPILVRERPTAPVVRSSTRRPSAALWAALR